MGVLFILICYVVDTIYGCILSIYYSHKCNYNCSSCGMWSCSYKTKLKKPSYLDFSNICGKRKGV